VNNPRHLLATLT